MENKSGSSKSTNGNSGGANTPPPNTAKSSEKQYSAEEVEALLKKAVEESEKRSQELIRQAISEVRVNQQNAGLVEAIKQATLRPEEDLSKYPRKNFLEERQIKIEAVKSRHKWASTSKNPKDLPFILHKTKRSWDLPRKQSLGGQRPRVLDNITRVVTPQYPNEAITEQEFFERQLNVNLSLDLPPEQNYWAKNSGRIYLTIEGKTLDLRKPQDVIQYKIACANEDFFAKSKKELIELNKLSYDFVMVERDEEELERINKAEITSKAWEKYKEITKSSAKMISFLRAQGHSVSPETSKNWLISQIASIIEADLEGFYRFASDPSYEMRVFVGDAVSVGAIDQKGSLYFLPGGQKLGNMSETIDYFVNPENTEFLQITTNRIKNAQPKTV